MNLAHYGKHGLPEFQEYINTTLQITRVFKSRSAELKDASKPAYGAIETKIRNQHAHDQKSSAFHPW
jgi:hypothetical protein